MVKLKTCLLYYLSGGELSMFFFVEPFISPIFVVQLFTAKPFICPIFVVQFSSVIQCWRFPEVLQTPSRLDCDAFSVGCFHTFHSILAPDKDVDLV